MKKDILKYVLIIIITAVLIFAASKINTAALFTKLQTIIEDKNMNSTSTPETVGESVKITDVVVGAGAVAKCNNQVTVHYTGTLVDGAKFDSSYDRNQPFSFKLCSGYVIKGWDQGVQGMKVGGIRKLIIPPSLGYGNRSAGSIPPNSILNFEIKLIEVK